MRLDLEDFFASVSAPRVNGIFRTFARIAWDGDRAP